MQRYDLVAYATAALLTLVWGVSTWLFALEAWGARGEPKDALFEVWWMTTWCFGPLAIGLALLIGVVGSLRARAPAERLRR